MPTTKITVYRNQRPVSGAQVSLEFTGFTNMGFTSRFSTNRDGVAYVEHSSTGTANVYIDGSMKGTVRAPGYEVFYL